mmetsp:Transcript_19625/g.52944  ORF Transcript_19625/g.52944 Transcript_19625/m.52944 type:complete len:299 (-) Transcript_19625:287-1183(-)
MGADRPDSAEPPAAVIAIQNPGDADDEGGHPPPMLAVPVRTEAEIHAAAGYASELQLEEPPILHVRCAGCGLVVQFPLIPDVRRHGIICSVCTTVSYPYVDGHLEAAGASDNQDGGDRPPQPRAFLPPNGTGADGGGAIVGIATGPGSGGPRPTDALTGQAMALSALARVTKWFAVIDVFIVIVEAVLSTATEELLGVYRLLVLIALLPPILGYVGASWLHSRLVGTYLVYCGLMIGYSAYITYTEPSIWKLLLLLLEVYMARIVMRFFMWLHRLSAMERGVVVTELMAHGRMSLAPW